MRLLVTLFFLTSITCVAQLQKAEYYLLAQTAICSGTEQQSYLWEYQGAPQQLKTEFGSSIAIETGVGFRIINDFFSEATISYYISKDLSNVYVNDANTLQGYEFNRLAFSLKGVYFLPISERMNLNFKAGLSYYLPQNCLVYTNGEKEVLTYSPSLGPFLGFGANYEKKWLATQLGLRYRYESHSLNAADLLTSTFHPSITQPNMNSIDVVLTFIVSF